jgi:hypothetical protein
MPSDAGYTRLFITFMLAAKEPLIGRNNNGEEKAVEA